MLVKSGREQFSHFYNIQNKQAEMFVAKNITCIIRNNNGIIILVEDNTFSTWVSRHTIYFIYLVFDLFLVEIILNLFWLFVSGFFILRIR